MKSTSLKNGSRRVTIGLLSEELLFDIPVQFLHGIEAVAQEHDVNLVYLASNALRSTQESRRQANILYALITAENVAALLIASNLLSGEVPLEEFQAFWQRYRPLPMVSLGLALDGIPSVVLDNAQGMYAVVAHLIEVHGCAQIAFVSGQAGHPDAEERYQTYVKALTAHHLPVNPNLVLPGNFQASAGSEAVRLLLDEYRLQPGRDIQAIVTANDYMALGVLHELQSRGIRIPEEIAVAGFDNILVGSSLTPPLTTARAPFREVAWQGLTFLIEALGGKTIPAVSRVPAQIVIRQSCGCAADPAAEPRSAPLLPPDFLDVLHTDPQRTLWQINPKINHQRDIRIWSPALAKLRNHIPDGRVGHPVEAAAVDTIHHQLWSALSSTAYLSFKERQYTESLEKIGNALITTTDLSQLMAILATRLPQIGIPRCYLALYEDPPSGIYPAALPEWSWLHLAYTENGRIALPSKGVRFQTCDLIPKEFRTLDDRTTLIVEALYFQQEQIGFALFGAGVRDEITYANLRGQISATLHSALLVRKVQDHANALAAAYEEIRVLNSQLEQENVRMGMELDVVKRLQQMLLPRPHELTQIPGLDIVGYMQPADEVGGDYYDVLHDHGTLHIGIGDVTGHGLESGVIMLMTQAAVRTLIEHGETDPVKFVNTLNRLIYKNVGRMQADKNLTFALVQYQAGQLKLVGQHEEVLVVRQSGQVERINTMNLGFPVGLEPEITQWVHEATITLQPGDGIVLYTDGIPEAENPAHEQYGVDRLCEVLGQHWDKSAEAIKQAVVADVMQHIGTQKVYDDVTLVIMKQQT